MRRRLSIDDLGGHRPTRLAIAVAASVAILVGGAVLAEQDAREGDAAVAFATPPAGPLDPLAPTFARCQALGEAAARDDGCLSAWAQNRRRFLMLDSRRSPSIFTGAR